MKWAVRKNYIFYAYINPIIMYRVTLGDLWRTTERRGFANCFNIFKSHDKLLETLITIESATFVTCNWTEVARTHMDRFYWIKIDSLMQKRHSSIANTMELCLFCINSSPPSAAYMRQWIGSALVQIMACRLFGTKPLSKPMLGYCLLDPWEQTSVQI